jgi:hypothetical protein
MHLNPSTNYKVGHFSSGTTITATPALAEPRKVNDRLLYRAFYQIMAYVILICIERTC